MKATQHWFPAKRHGWGWGWPCVWQGWLVTVIYFALLAGGIVFIQPQAHIAAFVAYTAVITAAIVYVGWRKGEPPRWRWGARGDGS